MRPERVIVLGATEAKALLGAGFRVTRSHGVPLPWPQCAEHPEQFEGHGVLVATIHPSAVLRADDREAAFRGMVADLQALEGARP